MKYETPGTMRLVTRLEDFRRMAGMTQEGFASHLGIPYWTYCHTIQGKRTPGKRFLGRVLALYPDLALSVQIALVESAL